MLGDRGRIHFVGLAGNGVSALAQFHVMGGGGATGSDRAFDRGWAGDMRERLEALGIAVFPQDGSALDGGHDLVVASAAVEAGNADLERARALGATVTSRAEFLARQVAAYRTVAVAGTSGKSTVVAMTYEILEHAGLSASVITGGALRALRSRGVVGNASRGRADLLVVEADESDGSIVRYRPWLGVLLNLSKDHKEPAELRGLFETFRARCSFFVVHAGASGLEGLDRGATTFGVEGGDVRASGLRLEPDGSRFSVHGEEFSLPVSGRHNVENALAAIAACLRMDIPVAVSARALSSFQGVSRRFERVGAAGGIEVFDDFAHNPAKVAAALAAAQLRAARVHAVFQLHGYAPAKFLKEELIAAFSGSLRPEDTLWMPEIYYAGGTADKSVSAEPIARAVAESGRQARFVPDRQDILSELPRIAGPGDVILVMGARDPSLPKYAEDMLSALKIIKK